MTLTPEQIQAKVTAKLQSLPADERAYWQGVLDTSGADKSELTSSRSRSIRQASRFRW